MSNKTVLQRFQSLIRNLILLDLIIFEIFSRNNEKKAAFPEKVEKHHVSAMKSGMKTNSTKQEERQTVGLKDGGKIKKDHLASFTNYAVEPKVKFDVQPPIAKRKSEEQIVLEDVDNLSTKQDVDNLFSEQKEGQAAGSKDGVKFKEKNNRDHSFTNYAVEPKFDVQPQLTIRKSKEEIAFEQDVANLLAEQEADDLSIEEDVDNLFTEEDVDNLLPEQQVKQENPVPLISKAKNEKDPFSRTALMGKGHFIYRGRRREQEILREIKQVDTIKKEDKKLKREAIKAAAKTFASVARPAEHSFVISPAEHTIRVSPAFEHYSALPAIPRQPK